MEEIADTDRPESRGLEVTRGSIIMENAQRLQQLSKDAQKENRKKLTDLEEKFKAVDPKFHRDIPLTHHFAKDIYGRQVVIPADTFVAGKIHKHSSLNILANGSMVLFTEEGIANIEAPYVAATKPGIKRVVYCITECTWVTVHGTDETDLEKIEEQFIAKDYDEISDEDVAEYYERMKKGGLCLNNMN